MLLAPTASLSGIASSPPSSSFVLSRWQAGNVRWSESGFARFWSDVPTLQELTVLDALQVSHRHACYKHLINSDSTGGENHFGRDAQYHWLWAYSAQLDWQDRSGRLNPSSPPPSSGDGTIAPSSWWQVMNFMFSICVLQGAADAGLVALPVSFTSDTEAFLRQPAVQACSECWRDFWEQDHAAFVAAARKLQGGNSELELQALREELQRKVWLTHTQAMECGLRVSSEELKALPPDEAEFGLGWVKMVDLLASVVWKTDLATLLQGGIGYLPSQRLIPGAMATMAAEAPKEHAAVASALQLSAMPDMGLRLACLFWRRVARWRRARQRMPETLNNLVYGKRFLPLSLARLVALAVAPRSLQDAVGWLLVATVAGVAAAARHLAPGL